MKDLEKDKEWQRMLDKGEFPAGDKDASGVKGYQLLYDALREEPVVSIPPGFAEMVAQKAVAQQHQQASWFWVLATLSIVFTVVLCAGILFFFYPTFFVILQSYGSIIAFAVLTFVTVQIADYRLIQRRQFNRLGFTA